MIQTTWFSSDVLIKRYYLDLKLQVILFVGQPLSLNFPPSSQAILSQSMRADSNRAAILKESRHLPRKGFLWRPVALNSCYVMFFPRSRETPSKRALCCLDSLCGTLQKNQEYWRALCRDARYSWGKNNMAMYLGMCEESTGSIIKWKNVYLT